MRIPTLVTLGTLVAALGCTLTGGGSLLAQTPASAQASAPVESDTAALARAPLSAAIPPDPAVRQGTLPNGLRYYVRRNAQPANRVELRLVVNAGSVLEDDRQRGLAHVVEHMAFNGTRRFAKQEIVQYLESVGTRFGPDLNAYTSFDETVYELTVPTDSANVLARGLDILSEWAHAVTFDSAEVERERPVVIEEWRSGQGAGSRLRDQQFPVIFQGSPYASRLPIGTRESLESFRRADLVRFYQDWYRPDLMAVVAVGNADPARLEAMIRERFASIPAAPAPRPRPVADVPSGAGTRFAVATDPEATSTSVSVLYLQDPDSARTLADFRRLVVRGLHGQMLNARFNEIAQRADAPFLGAGSSYGTLVRGADVYQLGAAVADTGVQRGLSAVLLEAMRVQQHGFTDSELDRAQRDMLRRAELAYAEREKSNSASYAGDYVQAFLSGEPQPDAAAELALSRRFLPTVAVAEINALATSWMTEHNRVVIVTAPERDDVALPNETQLLALFERTRELDVEPWADDVAEGPLVAAPPAAGRVVETRSYSDVGVTEWTLSNGARVLLKPTDFKDDEILFNAWGPGGSSLVPDEDFVSASLATAVVELGGLGEFDLSQLEKALAGTAASVGPTIGSLEQGLSGAASPRDVETMFELAYLYLTAPRRDTAAFQSLLARVRPYFENRSRSPESAFADTLQTTLSSHHPRSQPITPATLDRLELDAALRIYRERFANAAGFTYALVGNFDLDSIRPLVEQWIGGLPAAATTESWRDLGIRPPDGVVRKVVRRGREPRAQTQLVFTGPAEYTLPRSTEVSVLNEILNIRLREALREELGGTYGVSVSASLSRDPVPSYTVGINFGSAPERVEELTAVVFAQLDSLTRVAPTDAELATVKEIQRRSRETALRQNGFWMGQLAAYRRLGLEFSEILAADSRLAAVTPEAIREAARRYLTPDRYVLVSLLPEAAPAQ